MVLLKSAGVESLATLQDYVTLAAVLAAANDECDFTNYSRKTLTISASAVDDTNNWWNVDVDNVVYTSAGGASNTTGAVAVVCYDPDTTGGDDTTIVPLGFFDIVHLERQQPQCQRQRFGIAESSMRRALGAIAIVALVVWTIQVRASHDNPRDHIAEIWEALDTLEADLPDHVPTPIPTPEAPAFDAPTISGDYGVAVHEVSSDGRGYSARVGCNGTYPLNVIKVDPSVDGALEMQFTRFDVHNDEKLLTRVSVEGPVDWYHLSSYGPQESTLELGRHWTAWGYPDSGGRQPHIGHPIEVEFKVGFALQGGGQEADCGSRFEIWNQDDPNVPANAEAVRNLPVPAQHTANSEAFDPDDMRVLTCYACGTGQEAVESYGPDQPGAPFQWTQGSSGQFRFEGDLSSPHRATDTWVYVDVDGTFGGEHPHATTSNFVWRNRSEAVRTDTIGDALQISNSHNVSTSDGDVLDKPFAWEFYEHRHVSPDQHDQNGAIGQSIVIER